jgi:hypothetical protein
MTVADEAILPNFSSFKRPNEGGNVYVDAALKLDEWTAQDGTKRHGFACCLAHTPFQNRAQ